MREVTAASYHLRYDGQDRIVDEQTGEPFNAADYSLMKYGNRRSTQAFAHDIAATLHQEAPQLVEDAAAPELLVAYKAVPPACYYLSRHCLHELNELRLDAGNEPGRIVHVYKDKVTATNYAEANEAERANELENIGFSLEGRSLAEKPVVILDDIRITGAAEARIRRVVEEEYPSLLVLGYVAIFNPAQALARPTVESDLNGTSISSVTQLIPTIERDNFDLNIRTLKMIMAAPMEELETFLEACPRPLLEEMYHGAIATGVDFVDQFSTNFAVLQQKAKQGVLVS